jgi:DNA-binding PadR family transcriptional regulator
MSPVRGHHHLSGSEGHGPRQGRDPFGGITGRRARRGDVRSAILRLLSETPMHGYQIIQELSVRSGGAWTPSAGSVYPALQMLADEELVVPEEAGGKKVFRLTDAGTAAVAATADQPAPWSDAAEASPGSLGFHSAVRKLMRVVFVIGKGGSAAQISAAVRVLDDARKKLYAILAED